MPIICGHYILGLDDLYITEHNPNESGEAFLDDLEYQKGYSIQSILQSVGNWRGLFDSFSSEWYQSTLEKKAQVLRKTQEFFECSFRDLLELYIMSCADYQLDAVIPSIQHLGEVYPEARGTEDFALNLILEMHSSENYLTTEHNWMQEGF